MKWLTVKEVRAAAKKSKRSAIACSKKHWWQLATATESETREKEDSLANINLVAEEYCALCIRFQCPHYRFSYNCLQCPLGSTERLTCCKEYQDAARAFEAWEHRSQSRDFAIFTKKAKAMYNRICEL